MSRFRLAPLLCALTFLANGSAQNLSADVQPALADQWKDVEPSPGGTPHCLKALDLLTAKKPSPDVALAELNVGIPVSPPPPPVNHGELYAFGGFGFLRRTLELTGVSSIGTLLQPGNPVVFSSGSNSGAFDAGGGFNWRFSKLGGLGFYAEAKVVRGLAINSGTTLVPISFGVRF